MLSFLTRYFKLYGGLRSIATSQYFHFASIISIAATILGATIDNTTTLITQIFPNLLGFSLGSFAIVFSINNKKLIEILSHKDTPEDDSVAEQIAATFVHFIVAQVAATILATVYQIQNYTLARPGNSFLPDIFQYIMNLIVTIAVSLSFFYPLTLTVAAASSIFSLISMVSDAHSVEDVDQPAED